MDESERAQRGYPNFKNRQKEDEEKEAAERWRKLEEWKRKEESKLKRRTGGKKGGGGGEGKRKGLEVAIAPPSKMVKKRKQEREAGRMEDELKVSE